MHAHDMYATEVLIALHVVGIHGQNIGMLTLLCKGLTKILHIPLGTAYTRIKIGGGVKHVHSYRLTETDLHSEHLCF
jgi:hypothetical protein